MQNTFLYVDVNVRVIIQDIIKFLQDKMCHEMKIIKADYLAVPVRVLIRFNRQASSKCWLAYVEEERDDAIMR